MYFTESCIIPKNSPALNDKNMNNCFINNYLQGARHYIYVPAYLDIQNVVIYTGPYKYEIDM